MICLVENISKEKMGGLEEAQIRQAKQNCQIEAGIHN